MKNLNNSLQISLLTSLILALSAIGCGSHSRPHDILERPDTEPHISHELVHVGSDSGFVSLQGYRFLFDLSRDHSKLSRFATHVDWGWNEKNIGIIPQQRLIIYTRALHNSEWQPWLDIAAPTEQVYEYLDANAEWFIVALHANGNRWEFMRPTDSEIINRVYMFTFDNRIFESGNDNSNRSNNTVHLSLSFPSN